MTLPKLDPFEYEQDEAKRYADIIKKAIEAGALSIVVVTHSYHLDDLAETDITFTILKEVYEKTTGEKI